MPQLSFWLHAKLCRHERCDNLPTSASNPSLVVPLWAASQLAAPLPLRAHKEQHTECLKHICSWETNTCNEHADLLARLQGVLRLSYAMCNVQAHLKAAGTSSRLMLQTAGQPVDVQSLVLEPISWHTRCICIVFAPQLGFTL